MKTDELVTDWSVAAKKHHLPLAVESAGNTLAIALVHAEARVEALEEALRRCAIELSHRRGVFDLEKGV